MIHPFSKFKQLLILIIVCLSLFVIRLYFSNSLTSVGQHTRFWNKLSGVYKDGADVEVPLPWFFSVGSVWPFPEKSSGSRVWPHQDRSDRIREQLMLTASTESSVLKTIHVDRSEFRVPLGRSLFVDSQCPVDRCTFVASHRDADAVLFKDRVNRYRRDVPQSQIWILYVLESPNVSGFDINEEEGAINWTATYREDSDIVTPYEKWMYYDDRIQENVENTKNYAAGKTKLVAWFVSNCLAHNDRLQYAKELQKYVNVDIYGRCGDLKCSRSDAQCTEMLKTTYKFYLAFENSNCRDYITEKFFDNGLRNDVVPIAMGAHPDDYRRVAPKYSYIHVDDFPSPQDLADYLNLLDANDDMYNAYFRWKGTGEFINTRFFCRLCALLHNPYPRSYPNFRQWWAGYSVCRMDGWAN